ncbi:MAG: 50S ribosomal protein L25 [Anaerolineae bacterium]
MSKQIQLEAENRTVTGKKVNQLRREGVIPAVVYGHHVAAKSIQVDERALNLALHRAGTTHLITIQVAGGDGLVALVKDIQRESTTQRVTHVDFQAVSMDEPITTTVPIVLEGASQAVEDGGTLLHNLTAVEIRALPANLIDSVVVDISPLIDFDAAIHVSDLKVPSNVEVLNDVDELVAKVTPPRVQAEEEEEGVGAGESPKLPEVISETEAERRRGERAEE